MYRGHRDGVPVYRLHKIARYCGDWEYVRDSIPQNILVFRLRILNQQHQKLWPQDKNTYLTLFWTAQLFKNRFLNKILHEGVFFKQ